MSELQTVECRFDGEWIAGVTVEDKVHTLYRTPEGSYFVHIDKGDSEAYLVAGGSAAMSYGHISDGISEDNVRKFWPELLSAAALD